MVKKRTLHEWGTREKRDKIFLIKAENAANSQLLASFSTKSRGILAFFIRVALLCKGLKKAVLGFLLLNATVAFAQTQAELVKPLQNYVDNLRTFSADFVQVQPDEETFQLNQSKGHFDLKRPGRLYWHYDEPEPQTIVMDGKNLWVYDESIDQVTVRSVDEIKGDIPLGWLLFDDPIAQKFDIIRSGEKNGLVWYNLAPKEATYFQSLDIGMQNGHMTDVIMYQSSDNVTKVHFSHIVENRTITDSYFHFVPPIGVDVVGMPQ